MNSVYEQLREALAGLMVASSTRDAGQIGSAFRRISVLEKQLGPDTPPLLRHYLERRSYQKALDFLSTGPAESAPPSCR